MEVFDAGVEVLVHLDAVGVELELGRVEQRFVRCKAGDDLVHGLNKADDVAHCAIGNGGGDVACDRVGKRGLEVALRELLLPGALAVENVAEALNENVSRAQHIAKLAHLFCVLNGLIEGVVEVVRHQNGKVCVVGFELLVGMSVDDGQVVVVVSLSIKKN